MESGEKCIQEVAFEWLCESGAFKQLREQSEIYAKDCTVSSICQIVLYSLMVKACKAQNWKLNIFRYF